MPLPCHHLQHPLEYSVSNLQVLQQDGEAKELLIEGKGEATVNVQAMKHSQTHHTTNKVEIRQMFL